MDELHKDRAKDDDHFKQFTNTLLAAVVGKKKFRLERCTKKISKLCTLSSEAFVLVSLENSYEMWKAEYEKKEERPKKKNKIQRTSIFDFSFVSV